jgi:hypothetical protein
LEGEREMNANMTEQERAKMTSLLAKKESNGGKLPPGEQAVLTKLLNKQNPSNAATTEKTPMGTKAGKVYVVHNDCIRNKNGGMPYKVGITKNTVSERYYGLGLKMPGKFVCDVAYEFNKDYDKVETLLHNKLDDVHENGEWYNINSDNLAEIKQVCQLLGGTEVTDDVTVDIIESQGEEGRDDLGDGQDGINPDLEKIITRWDAASDMKTKGVSMVVRRVHIPQITGVCYRFKILSTKNIGIELFCHTSKYPALIDVFGTFDKLNIKGHVFDYKRLPGKDKDRDWSASVQTIVPLAMDAADVVEIMKSLIEATRGKIVEACK